jgi:hypothetical protein
MVDSALLIPERCGVMSPKPPPRIPRQHPIRACEAEHSEAQEKTVADKIKSRAKDL